MAKFFQVLLEEAPEILRTELDKLDDNFSEVSLQDEEKTDFSNGQTKVRRHVDQTFRAFREWLDAETNKNSVQKFSSSLM